jgi:hypothetical protein
LSGTFATPLAVAPELAPALELWDEPPLLPHAATASVNIPVTAIVVTPRLHLIGASLFWATWPLPPRGIVGMAHDQALTTC